MRNYTEPQLELHKTTQGLTNNVKKTRLTALTTVIIGQNRDLEVNFAHLMTNKFSSNLVSFFWKLPKITNIFIKNT